MMKSAQTYWARELERAVSFLRQGTFGRGRFFLFGKQLNMRYLLYGFLGALWLVSTPMPQAQEKKLQYEHIEGSDLREVSKTKRIVLGSIPDSVGGHGHVVLQSNKPGRLWDGSNVVRLKEAFDQIKQGKPLDWKLPEDSQKLKLLTDVLSPGSYRAFQDHGAKDPRWLLDFDNLRSLTSQMNLKDLLGVYSAEGNKLSLSFTKPSKVSWFESSQPIDIKFARGIFDEIHRAGANNPLACNQLIQKILKDDRLEGKLANEIDAIVKKEAEDTAVRRREESHETPREKDYKGDKDKPVIGKPGGTILSTIAEVEGLRPSEIRLVTFDRSAERVWLQTQTGALESFPIDPDDFAVAVRSIYLKGTDPVLSMGFDPKRPGYYSVEYSGGLYKTHLGRVLFEADNTLGRIMFNADSDEYGVTADLLPRYEQKLEQANLLVQAGRAYLIPASVKLRRQGNELQLQNVDLSIAVETAGWGAWYVQRSLADLAQYLTDNIETLEDAFDSFRTFQHLAAVTALVKWLHANNVNVDFDWVRNYAIKEDIFPSYVPADSWHFLFTGDNFDGWQQTNSSMSRPSWDIQDGAMTVATSDATSERLYFEHWGLDYDLEFLINLEKGTVDFIVRVNESGDPVYLTLPVPSSQWTKTRVKFMKGTLTLFVDDKESSSKKFPIPKEPKRGKQESFGFIAGQNSVVKIASVRFREPY